MRHGNNSKLLGRGLINDAVGEPTKKIASAVATEYGTQHRVGENMIGSSLKLSHKREAKFNICL